MSFKNHRSQVKAYMDAAERRIQRMRDEVESLRAEHRKLNTDLTTSQIASILGKSKRTVYRKLDNGQLKGCRMIDVIKYMEGA